MMNKSKEIETYYYLLDIAVLQGDFDKSKIFIDLLRSEYNDDPLNFEILKEDDKFDNLIQLGKIVDEGKIIKKYDFDLLFKEMKEKLDAENVMKKEKDLQRLLCKEQDVFKDVISKDFFIEDYEHKVTFGFVDLVGRSGDTVYVIELKKEIAEYDVVSQIDKYLYDFKVKLIYKMWKKVQGVVIASNFQRYALNELKKNNVMCIEYKFQDEKLTLRRI
jgi:Endonuclease NucS